MLKDREESLREGIEGFREFWKEDLKSLWIFEDREGSEKLWGSTEGFTKNKGKGKVLESGEKVLVAIKGLTEVFLLCGKGFRA